MARGTMFLKAAVERAKKHPGWLVCLPHLIQSALRQLVPQIFFICLGMGGAFVYLLRLANGPHVTWNKTKNPEPWNNLDPTYQYKFFNVTTDYKKLKKEGPDF